MIRPCAPLVVAYAWFCVIFILPFSLVFPPLGLLIPGIPVLYFRRRRITAPARIEAERIRRRTAWVDSL